MLLSKLFPCLLLHACTALAQCEAPVPCEDPDLNALETSECDTYHMFVARGSDSGYPGHLGGLIKLACAELGSGSDSHGTYDPSTCGYENIVFPANSTYAGKEAWCLSAAKGAKAGQEQMTEYAERCPESKLIVLGFSQGGSVAMDVLGGGGGPVFECVQADNEKLDIATSPGSKVVAAMFFGAVRRSKGQPYTLKGGKSYNGQAPRSEAQLAGLNQYADAGLLREFCNVGDPMCAVGSKPVDVEQHLNYFKLYNEEAAEWLIKKAQGLSANDTQAGTETKTKTKTSATAAAAAGTETETNPKTSATAAAATGTGTKTHSGSVAAVAAATGTGTGIAEGSAMREVGSGMMVLALCVAVSAMQIGV